MKQCKQIPSKNESANKYHLKEEVQKKRFQEYFSINKKVSKYHLETKQCKQIPSKNESVNEYHLKMKVQTNTI